MMTVLVSACKPTRVEANKFAILEIECNERPIQVVEKIYYI